MAARPDTRPAFFAAVSIVSAAMLEQTPDLAGDAGTLFGLTLRAIDPRVAGEEARYEARKQAWTAFFGLVTSLASAAITAGTGGGAALGKGVVARWAFSTGLGKSLGTISAAATTAVAGPAPDLAGQFPRDRVSWSAKTFVLSWIAAYPDDVGRVAASDDELRLLLVDGRLVLPSVGVFHDSLGRTATPKDVGNAVSLLQTLLMTNSPKFAAALSAFRGAAIDEAGSGADS